MWKHGAHHIVSFAIKMFVWILHQNEKQRIIRRCVSELIYQFVVCRAHNYPRIRATRYWKTEWINCRRTITASYAQTTATATNNRFLWLFTCHFFLFFLKKSLLCYNFSNKNYRMWHCRQAIVYLQMWHRFLEFIRIKKCTYSRGITSK